MAVDLEGHAGSLHGPGDLAPLLDRVGDARLVLLGEASHGTHEYYHWRAQITRRLIEEHGFSFVAVEGDWPDCYALDRCVKRHPDAPATPRDVLEGFQRWPTWMWANTDVSAFAEWLRSSNADRPVDERVGFYGLDVYSLWDSLRAIIDYLVEHEPEHVEAAMRAWRCFEPYREDPQEYAWATRLVPTSCEDEVVSLLTRMVRDARADGRGDDPGARFDAEQNAAAAAGAEHYYREMVRGGGASWNVRDQHMADTLDRLLDHHGPGARGVVWAHNTHVGDARATDMARAGMVNIGQLTRERHGEADVVLVGFAGYRGAVVAAPSWGAPMRRLRVPSARSDSLEALLHEAGGEQELFVPAPTAPPTWATTPRAHRAIGVVYDPAREGAGNYVPTVVADRYDALCYFDDTDALEPLHPWTAHVAGEHETYPFGR